MKPGAVVAAVLGTFLFSAPAAAGAVRVVGVQLSVDPSVYRTRAAFEERLDEAVSAAVRQSGRRPGEELVVVLPEHVGTFLTFLGESSLIYSAPTRPAVAALQVVSSPRFMLYHLKTSLKAREPRIFSTYYVLSNILRYKAAEMWKIYTEVSSGLAKRYGVTLVAGSISVPRPEDIGRPLAPIYGTSAVFSPDGSLAGIVRKVHPVLEELGFLTPAPADELRPVGTRAGRLGVLICSDSWFPDTYARLRDADILAIPSIGEGGHEAFSKTLVSVEGEMKVSDSGGAPTVLQRLISDGAPGRIRVTRAAAAVQPLLTGNMWDLRTGGPGLVVRRAGAKVLVETVPSVDGRDTFLNLLWKR